MLRDSLELIVLRNVSIFVDTLVFVGTNETTVELCSSGQERAIRTVQPLVTPPGLGSHHTSYYPADGIVTDAFDLVCAVTRPDLFNQVGYRLFQRAIFW
jgi:hypothetical protein